MILGGRNGGGLLGFRDWEGVRDGGRGFWRVFYERVSFKTLLYLENRGRFIIVLVIERFFCFFCYF